MLTELPSGSSSICYEVNHGWCQAAPTGHTRAASVSILLTAILSAQTGKMLQEQKAHSDTVCDLQMSADSSHLVTASKDKTAKLLDAQTLEVMKTYTTEYPVNTASLSPNEDHVCPRAASCGAHLHARARQYLAMPRISLDSALAVYTPDSRLRGYACCRCWSEVARKPLR